MRIFKSLKLLALAALLAFSLNLLAKEKNVAPPSAGILIKLRDSKASVLQNIQDNFGIKIERKLNTLDTNIYLANVFGGKSTATVLAQLKESPFVEIAEPNYIISVAPMSGRIISADELQSKANAPTDPMFNKLWGLQNTGNNPSAKGVAGADINALQAWDFTKGDRDLKIAIIDTGIDYNHPDLKENAWTNEAELNGQAGVDDDQNGYIDDIHGYDFANGDGDPMDDNNHGSHCAGTIGAVHDNGIGVAGVLANVKMMGVKFLTGQGSGSLDKAIESIDYATKMNVDLMSNSWGGGGFSQLLKESIERARDKGIVFVAAAGNSSTNNDTTPQYPASYEVNNIISVAAHNSSDQLASFSCYGKQTVHVAAPGQDILSTVPGNNYASYSGTSMATPHVSGIIGLLIANEGRQDFSVLKERLLQTSVPAPAYKSKVLAKGRINAYNLLADIRPPSNEPDPALWQRMSVAAFESAHPYENNAKMSKTYNVPGAKYIRVVVKKYDLEDRYDFLTIVDTKSGKTIETISGVGENYTTEYFEGENVTINMTSDYSVNKWGFVIDSIEYIK